MRENTDYTPSFRKGFGYKFEDVDEYIDLILEENNRLRKENSRKADLSSQDIEALNTVKATYSELVRSNNALEQEAEALRQENARLISLDSQRLSELSDILLAAQRTADTITSEARMTADEAQRQARIRLDEADATARSIVYNAEKQAKELSKGAEAEINRLYNSFAQILSFSEASRQYLSELLDQISSHSAEQLSKINAIREGISMPLSG